MPAPNHFHTQGRRRHRGAGRSQPHRLHAASPAPAEWDLPPLPPGLRMIAVIGGSSFGGVIACVLPVLLKLREMGADVSVEASDARVVEHFRSYGFTVHSVRPWAREISPWVDLRYGIGLFRLFRKHRFGLVHTHTSKANFAGRIAAWLAGVPVVVSHSHNLYYLLLKPGIRRRLYRRLESFAGRFQSAVVFPGEELRAGAVRDRVCREERSFVIRNAVGRPPSAVTPQHNIREELGLGAGDFVACSVGRLSATKDPDTLLRSWSSLASRAASSAGGCCPYLLLVGEGEQRKRLQELACSWGLERCVRFLGFRRDVWDILLHCDLFVTASLWEGQPISVLEAMATGLPLVATDVPGIRSVVRHGREGLLFAPGDAEALAEQVHRLQEEPQWASQLGRNGKNRASVWFDSGRMVQQTFELYARLLAGKGGRSLTPVRWEESRI